VGGVGVGGNLFVGGISVLNGVQSTNIVASGTLGVTGTSTLRVVNATSATFSGTLGVTGTSVLNGLSATNIVASGTLGVTGTSTLAGLALVTNTTSATSTNTGALQVVGGVGIGGDLRVGGIIYGTFNGSVTGTATTATNLAGGVAGQIPYQTAPGVTSFVSTGTAGNVLVSNGTSAPTYNNTLTLTGTTAATSTATGALQVVGGVGIGRDLFVEQKITGLLANGELLSLGSISNGADKYISIKSLFGTMEIGRNTNTNAYINSGMAVGLLELIHNSTKIQINASDEVVIPQSTVASSTSSGALRVAGGVGIGRSLFVQENIVQVGGTYSTLAATYNLINTTATTVNFAGAATTLNVGATSGSTTVRNNLSVAGNLTVQGTTTIVDSTVTNIADPIITLGGGAGNAAPTVDDNKDRGIAFKWVNNGGTTSTGFFGYDDSTGFLTYIQTATITNEVVSGTKGAVDANLAGGTAMSLVYQSAANTTAFLAAGSSGFILQTNGTGSAPTWVSSAGIGAGSATNADNIRTISQNTNAVYYPTFVDSNNAANAYELVYTTSSFSINPNTGATIIGTSGESKGGLTVYKNGSNTAINTDGRIIVDFGNVIGGSIAGLTVNGGATLSTNLTIGVAQNISRTGRGSSLSGAYIDAQGAKPISFATNSTERLSIEGDGQVNVRSTVVATSTLSGALTVAGGVGIGGTLYIGNLRADATTSATTWGVFYNTVTKELTTATSGSGATSASGTGTTSTFVINNSTAATSTNTGALQVVNGGAGIGGSVYVGGDIFTRGTRVIPLNIQEFVATAGQITFTISGGYTVGTVQVFANGINLDSVDFAASNGTTVVVAEPRAVNDRIKIVSGGSSTAVNNIQNFSIAMSVALSM
jgi:hypothetical protein